MSAIKSHLFIRKTVLGCERRLQSRKGYVRPAAPIRTLIYRSSHSSITSMFHWSPYSSSVHKLLATLVRQVRRDGSANGSSLLFVWCRCGLPSIRMWQLCGRSEQTRRNLTTIVSRIFAAPSSAQLQLPLSHAARVTRFNHHHASVNFRGERTGSRKTKSTESGSVLRLQSED